MALSGEIISYTEARNNLKAVMDKVWDDYAPVYITRSGGRPVVVLSQEHYESMTETEYLTRSKANEAELKTALREANKGKFGMSFTANEWKAQSKKTKGKRRGS